MKARIYRPASDDCSLSMDWSKIEARKEWYKQKALSSIKLSSRDGAVELIKPLKGRKAVKEAEGLVKVIFAPLEFEDPDIGLFRSTIYCARARAVKEKNCDPGVKLLLEIETKVLPNEPISNEIDKHFEYCISSTYTCCDRLELVDSVCDAISDAINRAGQELIRKYYECKQKKDTNKAKKNGGKSDKS